MSLLMDALKQAEHAKHGAKPAPPAPPQAAAEPMLAEDNCANLAELSLTPVDSKYTSETSTAAGAAAPDSAGSAELTVSPDAETVATTETASITEPETAAAPETATEAAPAQLNTLTSSAETATSENGHSHNSPAAAARILAVSVAQQKALRRRNIYGLISLSTVLVIAIGSYYYYAKLSQQTPFLNVPAAHNLYTAPISADVADSAVSASNEIASDATATTDSINHRAADTPDQTTAQIAGAPTTPWQAGPAPTAPAHAQDWEPAPVDPRVIRGEQPLDYADQAASAPAAAAPSIKITRSTQPNKVGLDLQQAYQDFQTGRLAQAEYGYQQVLSRDANNRDAHMGLAAIALRNNQPATARQHYAAILQRDPKDLNAQAALSDLGQDRSADSESQLKLLLVEQPQSAQLNFALANLYAQQQRWAYAQQAYFEAQRLAPEHPDYAFNLAVSLEHLGQSKLALQYYRRALQLAGPQNAQFDLSIAEQRISALNTQDQP